MLKEEFSGAVCKHLGEMENKDEAQGLVKGFSDSCSRDRAAVRIHPCDLSHLVEMLQ